MIFTLPERESIDESFWMLITQNKIDGLLPMKMMSLNHVYIIYDLNGKTALSDYKKQVAPKEAKVIGKKVRETLAALIDKEIPLSRLIVLDDYIYRDDVSAKLYFTCLPLRGKKPVSAFLDINGKESIAMQSDTETLSFFDPPEQDSDVTKGMTDFPLRARIIRCRTGESFIIEQTPFTIGRKEESVDAYISGNDRIGRCHCIVIFEDGDYWLVDNKSTNGSYMHSRQIMPGKKVCLQQKSSFRLADEDFVFELFP